MNIRVQVKPSPRISTSIKAASLKVVNLEDLLNVIRPDGLETGFTVVYDASLQKWVAQAVAGVAGMDGGSF